MLKRIRKAVIAGLVSGLGALGIDVSQLGELEYWQPIALAVITGFITYWSKANEPGTLTRRPVSGTSRYTPLEDSDDER